MDQIKKLNMKKKLFDIIIKVGTICQPQNPQTQFLAWPGSKIKLF